jgi:hypothetical protein
MDGYIEFVESFQLSIDESERDKVREARRHSERTRVLQTSGGKAEGFSGVAQREMCTSNADRRDGVACAGGTLVPAGGTVASLNISEQPSGLVIVTGTYNSSAASPVLLVNKALQLTFTKLTAERFTAKFHTNSFLSLADGTGPSPSTAVFVEQQSVQEYRIPATFRPEGRGDDTYSAFLEFSVGSDGAVSQGSRTLFVRSHRSANDGAELIAEVSARDGGSLDVTVLGPGGEYMVTHVRNGESLEFADAELEAELTVEALGESGAVQCSRSEACWAQP